MSELLRIPLDGGGSLLVSGVEPASGGPVRAASRLDAVPELVDTLERSLEPIRRGAAAVLDSLRGAGPDEIEVEFGVAFTAQAGAVIAKAGSECHLTVTLTWKSPTGPN